MVCSAKAQALRSGQVASMNIIHREGGPADQLADVRSLIDAGVDAIVINPSSGDAINDAVVVRPGASLVGGLTTFDRSGVDGVVEGGSVAVGGISGAMRKIQNGYVRSYALSLLGGALLVVLALLAVNLG